MENNCWTPEFMEQSKKLFFKHLQYLSTFPMENSFRERYNNEETEKYKYISSEKIDENITLDKFSDGKNIVEVVKNPMWGKVRSPFSPFIFDRLVASIKDSVKRSKLIAKYKKMLANDRDKR